MQCSECGGDVLAVAVPDGLRGHLPGDPDTVAVCRRCLTTVPLDDDSTDDPATVADLSDELPSDPETALSVALLVTLCESLALYRAEIEEVVTGIERAGVDPLLTLERLANDPDIDLALDVERRQPQLVQLLE